MKPDAIAQYLSERLGFINVKAEYRAAIARFSSRET